jgi:hypothetical protein
MKKTYLKTSLIAAVASLAVISNDAPAQRRPQPNEQINQEEIVIPTMTPRRSEKAKPTETQQTLPKQSPQRSTQLRPQTRTRPSSTASPYQSPIRQTSEQKPQVQQPQQQPRPQPQRPQPQRPQPQRPEPQRPQPQRPQPQRPQPQRPQPQRPQPQRPEPQRPEPQRPEPQRPQPQRPQPQQPTKPTRSPTEPTWLFKPNIVKPVEKPGTIQKPKPPVKPDDRPPGKPTRPDDRPPGKPTRPDVGKPNPHDNSGRPYKYDRRDWDDKDRRRGRDDYRRDRDHRHHHHYYDNSFFHSFGRSLWFSPWYYDKYDINYWRTPPYRHPHSRFEYRWFEISTTTDTTVLTSIPEYVVYECRFCHLVCYSTEVPPAEPCGNTGYYHSYQILGLYGPLAFSCAKCGIAINCSSVPNTGYCGDGYHVWQQLIQQ